MTLLTEQEAKEKWCPMARQPGRITDGAGEVIGYVAQNRGLTMGGAVHNTMCLGTGCMAWRWSVDYRREEPTKAGYCGAFGEPS